MKISHWLRGASLTVALALTVGVTSAMAGSINGTVWINQVNQGAGNGDAADLNILPTITPSGTFTTNQINFNSNTTSYTIGPWLNNPSDLNPSSLSTDGMDNTIFEFTGETYLNAGANSLVVGHDDGAVLWFGSNEVVNAPFATSFDSTPFTYTASSAGYVPFTLWYGECCGAPAILEFTVNGAPPSSTPEPASLLLLGTGLLGAGLVSKKLWVR